MAIDWYPVSDVLASGFSKDVPAWDDWQHIADFGGSPDPYSLTGSAVAGEKVVRVGLAADPNPIQSVNVLISGDTPDDGATYLQSVSLRDAADGGVYFSRNGTDVLVTGSTFLLPLTRNVGLPAGHVFTSPQLEVILYTGTGQTTKLHLARLRVLYGTGSGGSGGTGPGGQVGQNASILIPTMVQP